MTSKKMGEVLFSELLTASPGCWKLGIQPMVNRTELAIMAVLDLFLASYRSNRSAGGSRQRFRGRPAHPLAVLARRVAAVVLLFAGLLLAPATTQAQTESGWRIDTIAGTGKPGHGGDGGRAIEARLSFPSGVAVDNAGNVYIADFFSHRIRGVDTTGTITNIAGTGKPGHGGDGGQAIEAQLSVSLRRSGGQCRQRLHH